MIGWTEVTDHMSMSLLGCLSFTNPDSVRPLNGAAAATVRMSTEQTGQRKVCSIVLLLTMMNPGRSLRGCNKHVPVTGYCGLY